MKKQQKVILLGDSITQGLGSKKINFTQALQNKLGNSFSVMNMALTGTTIFYAKSILNDIISHNPDYVILLYGNVDAQIRPNRNGKIFPHIPSRFRKNGMLMPRPFYSRSLKRRLGQRIDNTLRKVFSSIIYQIDGTEQWVKKEKFREVYTFVTQKLKETGSQVLVCSTVYLDEKMFPGSLEQYRLFNEEIYDIAEKYQYVFIDLYNPLKNAIEQFGWEAYYNYDHFHPNSGGYELISYLLAQEIQQNHQSMR